MNGKLSVGKRIGVVWTMPVFCVLFSVLLLITVPVAQPTSAKTHFSSLSSPAGNRFSPLSASAGNHLSPLSSSAGNHFSPLSSSAKTRFTPGSRSFYNISRSSARYHRCSDGIWRKNSYDPCHVVLGPNRVDLYTLINKSFSNPLYFLQYIRTFRSPEVLMGSSGRSERSTRDLCDDHSVAVCCFTGDIMCLRGQQYDASVKKGYDFRPSYSLVADIFQNADFVCGNLETLLSPSNPLTKDRKTDDNGTPLCNGPEELLRALRSAGYDMLVTANNHCCDYGALGITETKATLDRYLFANVGTSYPVSSPASFTADNDPNTEDIVPNTARKDHERNPFCIFEINGIKIAILSYTHLINQRSLLTPGELDEMVGYYDQTRMKNDISAAKAAGAEYIAVYCHWGIENTEELTAYEISDSEIIAEAGADIIIGSHPHCLQSCRYIKTSDNRSVFCIYSMGNFCSSMARDINNDTIILRVVLDRDPSGLISPTISYIPCHVTAYRSRSFVVVPTDPAFNGGLSGRRLKDADDRITLIIDDVIKKTGDGSQRGKIKPVSLSNTTFA